MNPSPRIRYPRKERNSNYAVMTAFTLVAEVAEQIISGVAHLTTKEALRDLQNSPTTHLETSKSILVGYKSASLCQQLTKFERIVVDVRYL